MLKRIRKLVGIVYNYIVKGEILIEVNNNKICIDEDGNLFIVSENIILNPKGYFLVDCDREFLAKLLTYYKNKEYKKIEELLLEESSKYSKENLEKVKA